MRIDKNSYGTVLGVVICCSAAVAALALSVRNPWISVPACFVLIWFTLFVVCFFRVPVRKQVGDSNIVTSAADGMVCFVGKETEGEYIGQECIKVSVYMNFFDMHANFWPVDGKVSYYRYHPGKHLLVFKPKASLENEHTCTCITTSEGKKVFFKQIAGGFARRIVNYSEPGLEVKAGTQCGIIKFGSRLDMYLPPESKILVKVGQTARAAETIIAEI